MPRLTDDSRAILAECERDARDHEEHASEANAEWCDLMELAGAFDGYEQPDQDELDGWLWSGEQEYPW